MGERRLRHAALVVGGYWLFFTWLFAKPILERAYLVESDLYEYFLPLFLAPITIWSSFEFGGMPVFADPGDAAFYPLSLLFRTMGSWNGLVIAAFVVAAAGTYAYVYSLTRSRVAATAAGLTYALSEAMLEHVAHFGVLHTIAWLPLAALAIDRLRGPNPLRWVGVGALLLATCFLGGNPQTFLYGAVACALYALAGGLAERAPRRYYVALLAMAGLGGLLTAVKSLPMLEASLYTARQTINFGQFIGHANTPVQMLTLLLPAIVHEGREAPTYVGVGALIWAAFALRQAPSNWRVIFWGAIAVVALALGAGESTPLAALAYKLPAYSKFRVVGRHLYLAAFALSALAGFGIADARRHRAVWLPLAGALAITTALYGIVWWVLRTHAGTVDIDQIAGANWIPVRDVFGNQVVFFGFVIIATVGFALSQRSRAWSAVLLVVLALDLVHALPMRVDWTGGDFSRMPGAAAGPSVQASQIKDTLTPTHQRMLAPAGTQLDAVVPAVFARVWQVPSAGGYGPMLLADYGRLAQMGTNGAVEPSALAAQNAGLDLTATRLLVVHAEDLAPSDTIERRGLRWNSTPLDWSVGPPECGQVAPRHDALAIPSDTAVRSIALVMHLRCGEDTPQGATIGTLQISSGGASIVSWPLRAGVDVAEEGLANATLQARAKHQPADIFDTAGERYRYFLKLDLPQPLAGATLDFTVDGTAGALIVDRITAVTETGASVPQTATSLALSEPRRWHELSRFSTSRTSDRGNDTNAGGEQPYVLYENLRALPRAWLASEVVAVTARELETAVHYSRLPDGRPFEPSRTALVAADESAPAAQTFAPGSTSVTIRSIRDGRIRLAVSSTGGGFLVLSENTYPGWRAYIDDNLVPIHRTDGALQGIVMPAGTHDVSFEFSSTTLRVGAGVTVAAMAASAMLLLVSARRRRDMSSSAA